MAHYNWQEAFVAYCNGTPMEEISQICNIPLENLLQKSGIEKWHNLSARLPMAMAVTEQSKGAVSKLEARFEIMQENREQNLKVAKALRDDLTGVIAKLRDGTLKMEKQWNYRGVVTRAEVEPTLADRVNLATYARVIADLTYRALGDVVAGDRAASDTAASPGASQAPAITVILPGIISQPRSEGEKPAQVIDLR